MTDDYTEDAEDKMNEQPVPEAAVEAEVKGAAEIGTEPATEVKPAADAVQEDEAKVIKSRQLEKQNKRKARRRAAEMALVVSWFAACGRCSFFLAGYKVAGGEEALVTAVANRGKHWLPLSWTRGIANLVHKSYGSRVDIDCYHYEGCCSECQRHFVYRAAEGEDDLPTLRIELKTRQRQ